MKVSDLLDRVHPADEYRLEIEDEEAFLASLELDIGDVIDGENLRLLDEVESTVDEVESAGVPVRRCADCPEPAMTRKGSRGPEPKRCGPCTAARKRWLDSGGSQPRKPYQACCKGYKDSGKGNGLCPQHEQSRDETREQDQALSVSEREAVWLAAQLDGAAGWHIEGPGLPKGWKSARGPWEGRTRPEVCHLDPFEDDQAREWLTDKREQFTDDPPKSNPVLVRGRQ